ncbi:type IV secretion system protein [Acidiphilium cryptum]|jgi:type IV secretion system protein VirB6|uniref:TrbL/VirB6 plasmid conjugal transfer protein n=3 Tax=Acidiphilium TaxID=522 RepID=A5FU43_ACICJ|nr:type IV secretion system protein [Acidiphilium cryptum]ABQ29125.1 TrbL/VirB6 plasmid conjugal transfer protein [Acidiphilium cryptum JF-5]UBU63997.1 type IV secretion system protein [Acidithiobacillus ferrooxidans]
MSVPNTTINIFEFMYNQYSTGFLQSLNSDVGSALSAALPPLSAALVIWVIILGYLMMTGSLDIRYGISKVSTMAIVVGIIASTSLYDSYVQTLFMKSLPSFVASTFSSGNTSNIPQSLDQTFNNFWVAGQIIYKKANCATCVLEPYVLGIEIELVLVVFFIALALVFAVYLISTTLTGLLVAIGPFLLIGYLFEATKGIPERWLGKLIGLAILLLLITALLSLFTGGMTDFLNTKVSTTFTADPVQTEIIILGEIAAYTAITAFITIMLPGIAAYIGGGVDFNISGIVNPANWFK